MSSTAGELDWAAHGEPAAGLPEDRQRLLDELARSLTKRMTLANVLGATVVWVIGLLSFPALDPGASQRSTEISLGIMLAYLGATAIVGPHIGAWLATPIAEPLLQGRRLTPQEKRAILMQPLRQVVPALVYWAIAAGLFGVITFTVLGSDLRHAGRVADITILGGLTSCTIAYLLVEQRLRPVFAIALAGELPERTRALGIAPRLLLSWALGSGIPLAGIIAISAGGFDLDRSRLLALIILLGSVGLLTGGTATIIAARSVSDPLAALTATMTRVQGGNLDVRVTVDDGGDVGFVQAGFNSMVAGLRERERVRDLFGRHVGIEVARRALERTDLGGEQRSVSVLFVDIVASTRMAVQRAPAEVVGVLNALFDVVVRVASSEGGWVNKFEGDAALCVFGAPDEQPDHAARCCRAARRLRGEVAELGARVGFDSGIGVSSGDVVAGNIGAAERYEYTVIGDPVNEAARLTEAAKGRDARVLASEAAIEASGDEARHWREEAVLTLRGRDRPTRVFVPADSR